MYVDTFDEAKSFHEDYAAVRIGFEWFVAHLSSKSLRRLNVINRPFNFVFDIGIFTEGRAPVRVRRRNGVKSEGFIDTFGDFVILPKYAKVYNFHNGFAPVVKGRRLRRSVLFCNPKGVVVRWYQYNTVSAYGDFVFPVRRYSYWGYLDTRRNLSIAVPFRYLDATPFSENTAFVQIEATKKYKCIDSSNNFIMDDDFDYGYPFSDGYALIYRDDLGLKKHHGFSHGFGFINKKGYWLVKPSFFKARPFSNKLSIVGKRRTNGSLVYGVLDTAGVYVVEPKYEQCLDYSNGMSAFCKNGMWGFLDKEGKEAIDPTFYKAFSFSSDNTAVVEIEPNKYKYIDKCGKFLKFRYNYKRGYER